MKLWFHDNNRDNNNRDGGGRQCIGETISRKLQCIIRYTFRLESKGTSIYLQYPFRKLQSSKLISA